MVLCYNPLCPIYVKPILFLIKVYNSNQYSTQPPQRYKRERRVEMNSGKRSQYNPNSQRFSGYEEKYSKEDKNSSENSSSEDEDSKSCALHCLLDHLEMVIFMSFPHFVVMIKSHLNNFQLKKRLIMRELLS